MIHNIFMLTKAFSDPSSPLAVTLKETTAIMLVKRFGEHSAPILICMVSDHAGKNVPPTAQKTHCFVLLLNPFIQCFPVLICRPSVSRYINLLISALKSGIVSVPLVIALVALS